MLEARIKSEDLRKLRIIGRGTEGIVYNAGKGILYKLYTCKDDSHSPEQIQTAVSRQPLIKHSTLPLGTLYVDDAFAGCILKYHHLYTNIHNICILPKKMKLEIIRKIIMQVKELTDNNINNFDLANKKDFQGHNSNILISLMGNIQIIDLDGRGIAYTDEPNEQYRQMTLRSLLHLLVDLLYDFDYYGEEYEDSDLKFYGEILLKKGLSEELVSTIVKRTDTSYDAINQMIDDVGKRKGLVIS